MELLFKNAKQSVNYPTSRDRVSYDDRKATVDYHKLKRKMKTTTRYGLQERQNTPLVLTSSEESFNSPSLETNSNVNSPVEDSKSVFPVGSGYNSSAKKRGNVPRHKVFVLSLDGKPLTPTTNAKARKLMKGKQARPIWNKFGQFGIQMLTETRKEIPKGVIGIDFGTKFEGYSVVVGKENNLNVMWKLPDKKKLVRKLEERRTLRRARRFRNCRRREARVNNRSRKDFIAPSQLQIIQSRLKCINELMKSYPLDTIALEDVKFNHKSKRWGRNFSTIEVGKKRIYSFLREQSELILYQGRETQMLRELYGYRKTSSKDKEVFNSHCCDSLTLAIDISVKKHLPQGKFIVVDDSYKCVRRRLHDSQYSKGNIRYPFSSGNFKGIRKGTIIGFNNGYGQLVGGTKDNACYQDFEIRNGRKVYQKGKMLHKIMWLSHGFKYKK